MARLTQEEFVARCNVKHNNQYNYSKTLYTTTRDKIIVTCLHHGDFYVLADNHLRQSGCPKCGTQLGAKSTTLTYTEFVNKVSDTDRLNLLFYEADYINSRTPITVLCKKHNYEFKQKPYDIYTNRTKCKHCLFEKLSNKSRSNNQDFIMKAREIYNDRYLYDNIVYTCNTEDVKITCKQHGIYSITPKEFLRGYHCKKCMKQDLLKRNSTMFFNTFKDKWPNYTIKSEYNGCYAPLLINCNLHGDFYASPEQSRTSQDICDSCRVYRGSQQELKITNLLDKYNIEYQKHKKIKGDKGIFEIDIFLPKQNIAIEVNGLYWHRDRDNGKYSKDYHLNKTVTCFKQGITLLHFYDTEIDTKFSIIKSILENKLNLNTRKVHGRKTIIKYVSNVEKKVFLDTYHMQGNDRASICIGLYYNDELLSIMTFGTRKITGSVDHELLRYCVKSGVNVVGGFSKLIKFYSKQHNITTIKTYADKRYSQGNVYNINGFKHLRDSAPSYWYFNTKAYKLHHRYNFAKHLLKSKLEYYDENKTEYQNMRDNNYFRVWDCGHCVFEYTV